MSAKITIEKQATALKTILDKHKTERVVVLGGTCVGKTTLLAHIPGAQDMDKLVFPLLTETETKYVRQKPWTPEIGKTMTRLTKERVKIESGEPVFGTIVLDADHIICLKISDELLRERTALRGVSFDDAKNMQAQIDEQMAVSDLSVTEFNLG